MQPTKRYIDPTNFALKVRLVAKKRDVYVPVTATLNEENLKSKTVCESYVSNFCEWLAWMFSDKNKSQKLK